MDGKSNTQTKTPRSQKLKKMELLQLGIESVYQDKFLCDVQLQAEERIFPAHKIILVAMSDYFRAMFSGGFKESNQGDKPIIMEGVSALGLQVILDSLYTMELKLTPDNILETIPVACMLQIKHLIDECERFLMSSMTAEKYFIYEEIAERFNLEKAMECFVEYKTACFPEISQTLDFKELNVEDVVNYLSIPDLFLHGKEITSFDAAVNWLEHKPEQRKEHVLGVLKCINLLQISKSDIIKKVSKVKVIMENTECEKLVKESLTYHREVFTQPFYDGNIVNTRGVTDGIVAFPFWWVDERPLPNHKEIFGDSDPDSVFWQYLSVEGKISYNFSKVHCPVLKDQLDTDWVTSEKPESIDLGEPVKIGNFIFVFTYNSPSDCEVEMVSWRYNPITNKWLSLKPAPIDGGRKWFDFHQCAKKHIMLLGKEDEKRDSSFYFIYSIVDDEWKRGEAKMMELSISGSDGSAYQDGYLYISVDKKLVSYDMEKDSWLQECMFPWRVRSMALLEHRNSLLAFTEDSGLEYNLKTKNVSQFSVQFPTGVDFMLGMRLFTHGENVYLIFAIDECIDNKMFRFDLAGKTFTFVRDLPWTDLIYPVPMLLPRL